MKQYKVIRKSKPQIVLFEGLKADCKKYINLIVKESKINENYETEKKKDFQLIAINNE